MQQTEKTTKEIKFKREKCINNFLSKTTINKVIDYTTHYEKNNKK